MTQKNTRLVYSSDGSHLNICKSCKESPCQCQQAVNITPADSPLKIRIEKKGRGGKAVTVVFNLPHNPDYFKALTKKLKSQCGTGGSFKDNTIEIQGQMIDKVKAFLEKVGFPVKVSGGY